MWPVAKICKLAGNANCCACRKAKHHNLNCLLGVFVARSRRAFPRPDAAPCLRNWTLPSLSAALTRHQNPARSQQQFTCRTLLARTRAISSVPPENLFGETLNTTRRPAPSRVFCSASRPNKPWRRGWDINHRDLDEQNVGRLQLPLGHPTPVPGADAGHYTRGRVRSPETRTSPLPSSTSSGVPQQTASPSPFRKRP